MWLPQSLFNSGNFIVIFYFQEWDERKCFDTEVLSGSKLRLCFDEGVWGAGRIIISRGKKVPRRAAVLYTVSAPTYPA